MNDISIKKAAVINAVAKYSTIVLNLGFSAVLARLLTPEDYGIVAVTAVFTTFFSLFADMGIGAGVIQNKDLTQDDINSIFTFSVKISFILSFSFMIFSVPMSLFYKDKVYISVGILLSFSLFFSAMNMVPNALLLKEKKFIAVGVRTIIVCVLTGLVGILFAFLGFKYYALILQNIFNALFIFIWNYISTKPKVVKKVAKESVNKIRNYSSFLFGFNLINYFARNSDNLLISKTMGTAALGYYDKAYKLMLYPVQNLTHVITPVLHPILSEHQSDKQYIYEKYCEIVKILSLAGVFITPFCFFAADEIIRIMFGEKWIFAIPCFRWMALSIWAQMILSSSGTIFQSVNDTKRLMVTGTINAVMTVLFIVAGLIEGNINAVSRNIAISYNLQFIETFFILVHISLCMKSRAFFYRLLPDFIILLLLFAAGFGINYFIANTGLENIVYRFVIRFFVMLVVYVILLMIFKQHKSLLKLIRK